LLGITLPTAIISQLAGWHSWYPVAKFHFTAHVFTGFCCNKHNLLASLWGSVLQTISHDARNQHCFNNGYCKKFAWPSQV